MVTIMLFKCFLGGNALLHMNSLRLVLNGSRLVPNWRLGFIFTCIHVFSMFCVWTMPFSLLDIILLYWHSC